MATRARFGVIIFAVFVFAAPVVAGPIGQYVLIAGDQNTNWVVQDAAVVTSWAQRTAEYPVAVGTTVRAVGYAPGNAGTEYTLAGVQTGVTYVNGLASGDMYDGTTDGIYNYGINWSTGDVTRFDLDWSSPVVLFNVGGGSSHLAITYDSTNNSIWVSGWGAATVSNYSMAGALLSSFPVGQSATTCLALDTSDGTLWFGSQNTQGTFYQYSKAGAQLSTETYPGLTAQNTLGGEIVPGLPGGLIGSDAVGSLFTVNTATGAGSLECILPQGATEIEWDNTLNRGILQGTNGTFVQQEFDEACTALGPPIGNGAAFAGMEWVGGVLYGMGMFGCTDASLHTMDPATGATTLIGPAGIGFPITGLAWDAASGTMYGVTGCAQSAAPILVTVNLGTGAATPVGPTGVLDLGSLQFGNDGRLYAGGGQRDGGNLYWINTANGAATLIGPTGFAPVTGLALVGGIATPSDVYGTKTVAGNTFPGSIVTYTITLTNSGSSDQPDAASDEFTDTLPGELALLDARVISGGGTANADLPSNTVTWNGPIAVGATVVIEIDATVLPVPTGTAISNQGTMTYDGNGDGSSTDTRLTDDPAGGGTDDPTVIIAAAIPDIPTLDSIGLVLLAMLLAGAGFAIITRMRMT